MGRIAKFNYMTEWQYPGWTADKSSPLYRINTTEWKVFIIWLCGEEPTLELYQEYKRLNPKTHRGPAT